MAKFLFYSSWAVALFSAQYIYQNAPTSSFTDLLPYILLVIYAVLVGRAVRKEAKK